MSEESLPTSTTKTLSEPRIENIVQEQISIVREEKCKASEKNTSELINSSGDNIGDIKLIREKILTHLSNYSGDIFFKSQQKDEPNLTSEKKREIADMLIDSSPSNFLARFGRVLESSHIPYFYQYKDMYEVNFYIQLLEKNSSAGTSQVKNQRFLAMNELIKQGKYFSMSEMRKRNPVHFYHLVEKYMTSEEKRELEQDQPKICNLSTIFMAHIDGDAFISKRKNDQLADQSTWDQYNALVCEEEEEEEDEDEDKDRNDHHGFREEKDFFREEFISSN